MENNNIAGIHERVYSYLAETLKTNELKFTLRLKNRGDRLNQGYWFRGDDNYLAFSFWKGDDWRNKTNNIFFSIDKDGTSWLNFVSYDDEKKIQFFSEVAEAIGMTQKTRARTGETFEHWYKNYKGTDYIASLDTFIKRDKKIIDAFIKSNGMQNIFEPIDDTEFKKAKKKVDAERKRLKKDQTFKKDFENVKSITLKRLELDNISLFGAAQVVDFHKNLTCLIGLNGTGKTSLLRGLVLAFTGYEQNETMGIDDTAILTSQLSKLLHIDGVKNDKPTYPIKGFNNVFGWVGYFMKRLVEVTPEGSDFTETPAIILIDEIDTYLHPKWQTKILAVLVATFPNVQFIVTTHSPYVVGSVPNDKIKIYICQKEGTSVDVALFDEFTPYGANIERLSEKLFGVKGRFVKVVQEKLEKLSSLINKGDLKESKEYLNGHFADIDSEDPDLKRSKMLIRTKEI